ncbi:hypothetical protein I5M32_00750 [Pedobacter sp. SD-b]|uniref:SGNH/GDSL hydrolase family protein n=1 Tax=Pedobacter segetis TaxID=2793069 RepID=A0ABS1BF31_9SPHI|nr:hypothetical protein [Pedobacter segetis]MBK0381473.1 hypothetical protein [Pedobacter segetis]
MMMLETIIYKINKSDFSYFVIKLSLFLFLVFSLDFIIGHTLRYFYFKQQSGLQYEATFAIEKTKANVLIFGSSRACNHYIPSVLEEKLGLTCYNAGRYGSPILYHLAVLKSVLKRYHPKMIILDVNLQEFEKIEGSYDVLSSLLPYYKTHPEMRSIIEMRGKYEKLKLLSGIYPFNSEMLTIAIGNTEMNKKRRDTFDGYIPLRNKWIDPIPDYAFPQDYDVDSNRLQAYKVFINDCKKANVNLYIACSPYLSKNRFKDRSISIAKAIAKKENVPFFDYSNYLPLIKPYLYHDTPHLNQDGARFYSNLVANEILKTSLIKGIR